MSAQRDTAGEAKLLALLAGGGQFTVTEIAEAIKYGRNTVAKFVGRLVDEGWVEPTTAIKVGRFTVMQYRGIRGGRPVMSRTAASVYADKATTKHLQRMLHWVTAT